LNGKTITVQADTVDEALSEIQTMESVSNDKLCLVYNGKIMNDDSLIEDSLLILGLRLV
jgi:hypothetical protein